MTRQPIPIEVSRQISDLAVQRAREGLQRRRWSQTAQLSLQPDAGPGKVGIKTTLKYLHIQEKGFGPFLMTALEGKVVPIKGKLFRVRGVGMPGMGYQDRKYEAHKGPIWREQRWRHPGIRAENFMRNAIQQALLESRPRLQQMVMDALAAREERGPTPNWMPLRAPRSERERPPTPNVMPQRAFWGR